MKKITKLKKWLLLASLAGLSLQASAAVTLEHQVKISDQGLHFDGVDLDYNNVGTPDTGEKYDFFFGRNISAHGDAVKTYKHYVFMTWYRGGKDDRHVMLSRYNTQTGVVKTIEFPHQHTGFRGDPLVGESHNTIGLSVSPVNGTIHMVYDMHAYDNNNHGGKFKDDFFRYSFSVPGTAEVADDDFTLNQFVKDTSSVSQGDDDYKHLTMTGDIADKGNFARLTYPKFFTNTDGTLLLYMRLGGNNNGGYVFNRYDAAAQKWSKFTAFNVVTAKNFGNDYNWGLYGNMKYVNGKLRVGFQQRSSDNSDRYKYQNGVYYAYSDHPEGFGEWKNHKGEPMTWPLVNSDEIKVLEPGDYISHTEANSVYIVGSFDWTVTAKGDVHFISLVRSTDRSRPDYEQVYLHSYKPAGADEFITTTDFTGASNIYTSGDNIYIIGLRNGYPYVEKAVGGTNDFVRIYEQTEGIKFDHGTVHIKDGKVYYYLMERASGSAMPLHLQVIDLDLEGETNAPLVSFPSSSMTVEQGYEKLALTLAASSPVADRTIDTVTLFINGEEVRVDNSVPYLFGHGSKPHETGAMGWLDTHAANPNPLEAGTHLFKAVATDSEGATSFATMQLTVLSNAPIVSFAQSEMTLEQGYEKFAVSIEAASEIEGRTIESVSLYINDEFVRTDDSVPYLFGHGSKPHETGAMGWLETHTANPNPFVEGVYTFTAVAVDSEGVESTAQMTVTVNGLPKPPTVVFPNDVVTVVEGYEKLGVTIQAESPVEGRTVESVALYRNGELVRVDTRPVWNFGHSHAPYELGAMGWLETHEPNPSPLGVGEHTFTAVATDSEGLTAEGSMTLIVNALPAPTIHFVESDIELTEGYEALSLSVDTQTANENVDVVSVILYLNDELVREVFEAPYTWGDETHTQELLGLMAGSHVFKAVVTDSNNRMSEASILVDIAERPMLGDLDFDFDVDRNDVNAFRTAIREGSISDMRYDFNNDGEIGYKDMRGLALLCTRSGCRVESAVPIVIDLEGILGDFDGDEDIDRVDVRTFSAAIREGLITDLKYDFNQDGFISGKDVRGVALLCTLSGCRTE
ncbi:BNR-4 repeat-containing protein [Algibacillus agarilyticus]|uniref:BNR-4 repeat-containing protein n=1 Tax=Algibacillus agarilyticus TaxID=2234133 RepID=UPI000DCFF9C7|nr:BNR-4 repeat-containing protein [Algibacillus agarilyticus]